MDISDLSSYLESMASFAPSVPVLAVVAVCLLAALAWYRRQNSRDKPDQMDTSFIDRFAATAPINEEQVTLLRYLQSTFPDGVVLFRPRLSRFLRVRTGSDRAIARRWLAGMNVDFLLCSGNGRPLFAFEIDLQRTRGDPNAQRRLDDKRQALRSAGIRLIRFKGALVTWPEPRVLRERVMDEAGLVPSGFGNSGPVLSTFEHSEPESSIFGSSQLSLSDFNRSSADSPSLSGLVLHSRARVWADVGKRS